MPTITTVITILLLIFFLLDIRTIISNRKLLKILPKCMQLLWTLIIEFKSHVLEYFFSKTCSIIMNTQKYIHHYTYLSISNTLKALQHHTSSEWSLQENWRYILIVLYDRTHCNKSATTQTAHKCQETGLFFSRIVYSI